MIALGYELNGRCLYYLCVMYECWFVWFSTVLRMLVYVYAVLVYVWSTSLKLREQMCMAVFEHRMLCGKS